MYVAAYRFKRYVIGRRWGQCPKGASNDHSGVVPALAAVRQSARRPVNLCFDGAVRRLHNRAAHKNDLRIRLPSPVRFQPPPGRKQYLWPASSVVANQTLKVIGAVDVARYHLACPDAAGGEAYGCGQVRPAGGSATKTWVASAKLADKDAESPVPLGIWRRLCGTSSLGGSSCGRIVQPM